MKPLYGRADALDRARRVVARAAAGEGALLLLTGEPGIGKSRLVEEIASVAAAGGAAVAWGRCWEAGGAPAYWPWIQLFRGLGIDGDPLAAVPELGGGAEEGRFRLFDRAVRRLKEEARRRPLALLLDDLHAADVPSLLLLLLLARELRDAPLLVVGAYREAEAAANAELAALLAKIAREGESLALARLSAEEVGQWLAAVRPGAEVARAVGQTAAELHRLSEGLPLFVSEILRLGGAPGGREGLGALLDERLAGLSAGTRALLEVGAVLGRELSLGELTGTAGVSADDADQALREALATGIVLTDGAGFSFAHVLLRDRLYGQLAPSVRAGLHWKAGTLLLARGEVARAAHHLMEGQSAGSAARVAEVALAAAEDAVARLAFEDAARISRRALELPAELEERLRGGLQLALAQAQVLLGDGVNGRQTAASAAELGRRIGASDLMARAALVYNTDVVSGTQDDRGNALLRQALAALPESDSPLRAQLMGRLASGLMPPRAAADVDPVLALIREATAMARRLGDAYTLLYVLQFASSAVGYIVPEEERFAVLQETVSLALALDQRLVLVGTYGNYIAALLGRGQRAEAEVALTGYERLCEELTVPHQTWRLPMVRAMFHALVGEFEEAEAHSREAHARARQSGARSGLVMWAGQRLSLCKLRGDPALIAPDAEEILALIGSVPVMRPQVAWMLGAIGRAEEGRRALRQCDLEPGHVAGLASAGEAAALLGDIELGARLYELLTDAPNRLFWLGAGAGMIGPTAAAKGELARLLGREEEARRHFDEAIALGERVRAPAIAERWRGAREALGKGAAVAGGARLELRREGELWVVSVAGGAAFRMKHAKGVLYLSYLLDQPGRDIHVLELVGTEHQTGDAGPVLDPRAKAEYRRRLDDLREEIQEGERFGDGERVRRAQEEIEAIADQLAGAVGLGGRDRRAASDVERARVNVQRRLKDAIDRIAALDPALGRYLTAAVKTGTYCCFTPV